MIGDIKIIVGKKEYTMLRPWSYKQIKEWLDYIIYKSCKDTDDSVQCIIYAKRKDKSYSKVFMYKNIKKETDKCLSVIRVWNSKDK